MEREKWLVDGPKVIDIERLSRLKVSLIGGQVDIVAHDEPTARVEVHSVSGKELKIVLDGDSLEIDHPQLRWDNFIDVFRSFNGSAKADISIVVPRAIALKFGVVTASALISGLRSDATISTVSGDLVVDGVTGALSLNAVNGEISLRNHTGRVSVHTVSGDTTVTGAIEQFTADGVSGDVFLDLSGHPDEIRVNTVSGNVTARLQVGYGAQYRINTVSGKLQLDDSRITGVRGAYTGRYGELDGAWLEFRANTVSGDVSILHTHVTTSVS
ncbi:DUF4097 family beta strand repeat-containing protein [Galbitalea soli]|uniref:DUF4097 family beta strand repeat protein n=1 Tax=Galbitalea soli TaxID=1268042 RepID=A0A7C9PNZ4_9MICO|nr:DUF4097 family beta strand repeat-containing protein [Galbitalea soli]NEM91927.1 DUF4097 family beta strand repeat protein [Galbitalea soli]NYJ29236.1 DUF4097 and DUF4098 domain-containing protein YvlB [Galbitalea soli]